MLVKETTKPTWPLPVAQLASVAANRDRSWLRGLKDMKLLLLVPEEGAGARMVGAHVPTRDKAVVDEGGAQIDFVATINLEPWAQTLK